jgi:serine/threonine-protein kinase
VIAAVERALAKKPDDRFADVPAFIEALTGRPLQTLGAGLPGNPAPGAAAPLSQEELMAATMAPAPSSAAPRAAQVSAGGGAPTGAPPVVLTSAPPGRKGSPLALIGVLVVLGGIGAAFALHGGARPASPPPAPAAVAPPPPAPPPAAVAPPPPVAEPEPPAEKTEKSEKSEPTARTEKKEPAARAAAEAPMSADVRADLEAAERALAGGDTRDAKRLAQHSLQGQRTSRAFAILTRAACVERDLTNARANLRNVAGSSRAAVVKACAAAGLDLR